jgi:hypothetical protein
MFLLLRRETGGLIRFDSDVLLTGSFAVPAQKSTEGF